MLPAQHVVWKCLLVVVFALALGGSWALPAEAQQMEDVVYLKDGSIIRGTIIEQRPGESILIQTRDGNVFRYTMDRIERITKEQISKPAIGPKKKSPALAWFLSFLIPGGGQAYNGQWGKAGLDFAGAVIFASVAQAGVEDCVNNDECADYTVGLVGYLAVWIASQFDAGMSASKINRESAGSLALEIRPRLLALPHSSGMKPQPRIGLSLARLRF